jgi:PAS domain S-box-containing protein
MMISSHKNRRHNPEKTIKSYEFRLIHRDGSIKNVLITVDLLPGTTSSIASLIDITDRKQAEKSLIESESMYRQLFMNAPAAIYEVDYRTRRFISITDIIPVLTGYSREELMEMDPWDLFTEESQKTYIERMKMMKDQKDISNSQEYSLKKKDGGVFWVNTNINYTIENGVPVKARIVAHDITERKKAEEEREKLISELKKALSDIKTLNGLLPICASCKKIRDDKGYWNQIELYIQSHSGAEFSHGICPDCAKKLYPEYYKDK